MKKHVLLKIILLMLILFLLSFHIIWVINFMKYKPFQDAVGKDEQGRYSYSDENNLSYSVFAPRYPRFVGNLSISDFRSDKLKTGDILIDMIIWPEFFDGYEVGISISRVTGLSTSDGSYSIQTESSQFVLDEAMNLINYDEEDIEFYKKYKDEISDFYRKAYDMWGILDLNQ